MASLKINSVDKIYHSGSLALYDINLEAKDKEFLVILGGEGSGKSTLLRIVAGLEEVSSGEIFIGDRNVTETHPKDRDIAMIFRNDTLYPGLSVYDNMAFGLRMRKALPALVDQRVKSAANILGLSDMLLRRPKALTAAQKQKVAIGRAITREPKVYLFDEPLSGLDEKLGSELLNVIINMQARMQGTFVYATKNVAEAMTIGTRIAVIKNGIIQQIDTPANLYDYPANAYVAFYIGAPTINFFENASLVKENDCVFAVSGEFKVQLSEKVIKRFTNAEEYIESGKKLVLGIRPEDITTCECGTEGKVTKVDKKGELTYAECDVCGHVVTVKAENAVKVNDKCKVKIDCDRIYLFDGETRLNVLARDKGYKETDFADADRKPLTFKEEEDVKSKFKDKKAEKKKKS